MLAEHDYERILVLGTTCTGKSTLVERIPGTVDMDKLVFSLLTKDEADYVCQEPWTPEIGAEMTRLTKKHIQIQPGMPVFGTVLLDADTIVYLKIDEDSLRQRTEARGVNFDDARAMQRAIEASLATSTAQLIEFCI